MTRHLFLTAGVAACLAPAACGGSPDPRAPRPEGFASCTAADVSGSTRKIRPRYVEAFQQIANETGEHGSGTVCLVLAAGDPQAEGTPQTAFVGPMHDNPVYAPGEISRAVGVATTQFDRLMREPPVTEGGSAIVEAAAVAAAALRKRDRLLLATDGLQTSDLTGDFLDADLSAAGIERLLDRIEGAHLLPDLEGVTVWMPLLLAHPDGLDITQKQAARIRQFWIAWAKRAGATLDTTPLTTQPA